MPHRTGLAPPSIGEGSAQYRDRHAEPESCLASLCPDAFDFAMVVPVCAEPAAFVDGYRAAVRRAGRLLLIAVLNGRAGAEDSVHALNAECFRELRARFSLREVGQGGWLGRDASMSVLVVDRFTTDRRLPARQGVGLARKIGADIALALTATGQVRHPFFAMMDADARLPADYFGRIAEIDAECSAAVFPLWHEPSGQGDVDRATALYEIRLRYFQRGLQWAHSPYAFHTVGSTMVVHALCYAQVRGVPLRQAGEDFYLLGKLSKLRPLARLQGEPVRLRSRLSESCALWDRLGKRQAGSWRRARALPSPLLRSGAGRDARAPVFVGPTLAGKKFPRPRQDHGATFSDEPSRTGLPRVTGCPPCLAEAQCAGSEPGGAASAFSRLVRWIPHAEADPPRAGSRGVVTPVAGRDPACAVHGRR